MLNRIIIDNFATIEHLSFDLGDSLNIITGETGAGKSVLVQAISTALGDRADISMVRTGQSKAVIQIAGDKDGEDVIITRELLSSGKSISKLNGEMVTLAQLRAFCADWVDIHGQYDNQQILNPDNHILITDSFHNEAIAGELDTLKGLYDNYRDAKKNYNDLLAEERNAKQQKDFLEYEFNYLSSLNLRSHEDEELEDRLDLMKNSERIYTAVNSSYELLHESDPSVLAALNRCSGEIASVSGYSDSLTQLSSQLQDIYYQLEDVSDRLRDVSSSLTFDDEELDAVSERLSAIEDAKRKYGKSIDEIIEYQNDIDEKLGLIQNFDYEKQKLADAMNKAYSKLEAQAAHVSELRHIIAERLESQMKTELMNLDFANSDFRIKIDRMDEIGPLGYDSLEFLISTNPGEPLMPLAKIASGGEISRIMLAFKHIIGDCDNVETMIFDEIDTGISGRTALTVGHKLKEIASHHQIVCITHLPQIAAYGSDNYLIRKMIADGKSHTEIEHLDEDGKEKMVATLFSGSVNESAIEAARELIERTK
ncbi:MAG: DNA repair protein RecN [Clostridiales bacterium]|nr:DNA repair protein RecN [Candidatus Crickella merdequi]